MKKLTIFLIIVFSISACGTTQVEITPTAAFTLAPPTATDIPPTTTPEPTPEPTETPQITADEYLYIEVMQRVVQDIIDMTKVYSLHWEEYDGTEKWDDLRGEFQNDIRDSCKIAEEYDVPDKFIDRHEELMLSCTELDLGFAMLAFFTLDDIDSAVSGIEIVTKGVKDLEPYASWLYQQ